MKYLLAFLIFTFNNVSAQTKDMMVRISEIEIDSKVEEARKHFLKPLQGNQP